METPEERIWILLSRKFSDSITDTEETELNQLLRTHPEAQYTYEILGKIWNPSNASLVSEDVSVYDQNLEESIVNSKGSDEKPGKSKLLSWRKKPVLYVAASALLLVGVSIYVLFTVRGNSKTSVDDFYTVSTKPGEKKIIFLPDSTEVWLNADSRLKYPTGFKSDSIRRVMITGEAYFKVKHDEHHPFIIYTKNMEIRDIGTEFNVKSYPDESLEETTLISGVIEVSLPGNERKILLKPKEKIVVYQNKHVEKYSVKDSMKKEAPVQDIQINGYRVAEIKMNPVIRAYAETAWMQNDLVFRNESFDDLARAMERKFGVKMIIEDRNVGQYQLTGIFRDESIEQALTELQVIAPFNYDIKDSIVTIFNK